MFPKNPLVFLVSVFVTFNVFFGISSPLVYAIVVDDVEFNFTCVLSLYISSGTYIVAPVFPVLVNISVLEVAIFVNNGPRSNVVIELAPAYSNI